MATTSRTTSNGNLSDHEKNLGKFTPEDVRKHLAKFRLGAEVMTMPPFVCMTFKVEAPYRDHDRWMHPLVPIALDDLKTWYGVPNESARLMMKKTGTLSREAEFVANFSRVAPRGLPALPRYDFEKLDNDQKLAVKTVARSLLHDYVDPAVMEHPAIIGVVNYMISAARGLKVFAAPDLIVCPDKVVTFKNVPVVVFNNILIYGNGQIVTESKTKIHALQIRHIN